MWTIIHNCWFKFFVCFIKWTAGRTKEKERGKNVKQFVNSFHAEKSVKEASKGGKEEEKELPHPIINGCMAEKYVYSAIYL